MNMKDFLIWLYEKQNMDYFKVEDLLMVMNDQNSFPVLTEKFKKYVDKDTFTQFSQLKKNQLIKNDSSVIAFYEDNFPRQLLTIDQTPHLLYLRGRSVLLNHAKCVSIIGSRNASAYGKKVAYDIAYALAKKGYVIVSGLAKGIDAYSHKGALKAGGNTIAVLGNGVCVHYPRENRCLYEKIAINGLLVSEFNIYERPKRENFPRRNRIISALSDSLIVVEAGKRSGTSITVNHALEQGKTVYSVPGNIYNSQAVGTNKLISQGAIPIISISDLNNYF